MPTSLPEGGRRKRRGQHEPQSAFEAADQWGDIDTTKVDVGRLAPRILEAQMRIPVEEARPVHFIRSAHECYVRVLVWDPFRDLIISGGGDGWIRIWSTRSYKFEDELDAQLSVRSLLVLTKELASGHSNGEVILWDMEDPDRPRQQTLQAHREAVYALAILRRGDLVTGAEDIRVFRRSTSAEGFQLQQVIAEEVLCMCTVPGGNTGTLVVTGNMNGRITVWETGEDWEDVGHCVGHERSVWAICYNRDASQCASGSADQTIRIWETNTWQCVAVLKDHAGWVVGFSCGPGWLLSCSIDQTVRIWDVETWKCARTFHDQAYEVYCVCAFGGGRFATGGAEMSVVIYGGPEAERMAGETSSPGAISEGRASPGNTYGADGQRLAASEISRDREGDDHRESKAQLLALRRKQLVSQSGLDMSMAGFRGEIHRQLGGSEEEAQLQRLPLGAGGAGYPGGRQHGASPGPDRPRRLEDSSGSDLLFETRRAVQHGLPVPDAPDAELEFETRRAVPRVAVPPEVPQRSPPPRPSYHVGGAAQVFSTSQNRWIRARVHKVEDGRITVIYAAGDGRGGEATKQLPVDHEHLRPVPEEAPAPGGYRGGGGGGGGGVKEWSAALLSRGGGGSRSDDR